MSFATASQFSGGTIFRITMYPSSSHVRQFSAVMTVSSSSSIEPNAATLTASGARPPTCRSNEPRRVDMRCAILWEE